MKIQLNAISQTDVIEIDDNSTKQHTNQSRFGIKGNFILLNTLQKTPIVGYGSCRACGCKGWIPNQPKNDYCKNCQHNWEMHRSIT
jgi:hypothetical protein